MKYILAALLAVVTAGCMVIPGDLLHHGGGGTAGPADGRCSGCCRRFGGPRSQRHAGQRPLPHIVERAL